MDRVETPQWPPPLPPVIRFIRDTGAVTDNPQPTDDRARANEIRRRHYDLEASNYDGRMEAWERRVFGTEHRAWACSRARGEVLEVAIGTGRNLPHYPEGVHITGLDLSAEMLAVAEARAKELGLAVVLQEGDAQALPFAPATFDSVVCTYSLCTVPDEAKAIMEMARVLKPGGRLILVDHVRSTVKPLFWIQKTYDLLRSRKSGEYMTRRPAKHIPSKDFEVHERGRLRAGVVERVVAIKSEA